jgi:hypothetical protein
MSRAHALATLISALAYVAAHAGWLPGPIYWPLTGAWSWSWGSPGGVSMRFYGLIAWAVTAYGVTALTASWVARGLGPSAARPSAALTRAALATTCAAMLYVLAAELAGAH